MSARLPWLEVVSAPGPSPTVGSTFGLPLTVGRSADNDVTVMASAIGRHHCRFELAKSRLSVEDLGSTNGTYVNGVRCDRRELSHGDCVELPFGLVFRVVTRTDSPPLSLMGQDDFIALVTQAPHDEGRWRVWSDRLLEAGNPLGERIAIGRGPDAAADARALGPLAREFVAGSLEIEWRHGFIRRAVLRNVGQWPPASWRLEWVLLLQHPLAHFIEEIEVDALSYARGVERSSLAEAETKVAESLEVLAARPKLPLLKSVRFGPSPRPLWNPQLAQVWARACERHAGLRVGPIWVARAAWLQLLSTPPGVSVIGLEVGAQRALDEDGANLVGALPECKLGLDAPERSPASRVALRLDRENGLWWAEDIAAQQQFITKSDQPLYVNGRQCLRHRLRPYDVLEPAPGLTFRFVME